jgi:hypothetical protein
LAFKPKLEKILEENLFTAGFFANVKAEDIRVPVEYLITYVVSANVGVIQTWLQKGCLEPPREMARILFKLTFSGPLYVLGFG